jgi:hypothetical protein
MRDVTPLKDLVHDAVPPHARVVSKQLLPQIQATGAANTILLAHPGAAIRR